MKLVAMVVFALLAGGCGKKKQKAAEPPPPPASVEQATGSAAPTPTQGSAPGSAIDLPKPEVRSTTPADDGGELQQKMKDKKQTPADDGGEAKQPD